MKLTELRAIIDVENAYVARVNHTHTCLPRETLVQIASLVKWAAEAVARMEHGRFCNEGLFGAPCICERGKLIAELEGAPPNPSA